MLRSKLLLLLPFCLVACTEGSEPGECDDGADNDQDSYYDCNDSDCYGAPVCQGDDDDAADDDDATDDDDAVGGEIPVITNVSHVYNAGPSNFVFTITAHDPDGNFGIPLLLWSVDQAAQAPVTVGNVPLLSDVEFDVQLDGAEPGRTYQVLFAIRDTDLNQSEGYSVSATAAR